MAIEALASVTQICLARELSAGTWLRVLEKAKRKQTSGTTAYDAGSILVEGVDIILPLIRKSGTPLSQSYLQACLVGDVQKSYLLKRLLEDIDGAEWDASLIHDVQLNNYLECLAATLLASNSEIITTTQVSNIANRGSNQLRTAIRLLAAAAQNQSSSLFLLMLQLLQVYQAEAAGQTEGELRKVIGWEITTCRDVLASVTSTTSVIPYPFELARNLLNALERRFDPVSYRMSTFVSPATFPSIPLEVELLVHTALYRQCEDTAAAFAGSIAARLAVARAVSRDSSGPRPQEVLTAWFGDLFLCCARRTPLNDEPRSRSEARWAAFEFGRLPALLVELKCDPRFSQGGLDWSTAIEAGIQCCVKESTQAGRGGLSDWAKIMQDSIANAVKTVPRPSEHSVEALIALLENCVNRYESQRSAALAVSTHLEQWAATSDLPAIHHFMTSLVKGSPRVTDYVLLHFSADALLKPICQILDTWNSSDEYGAGQAMECYGGILLALKTIVSRHALYEKLTEFNSGISSVLFTSPRTLGHTYSLHACSAQHQNLISSWITALFGTEGIEDDLIRSTPPRVMLLLAPTIVHQSVAAMENGIIDQETLLNGLSYFCQDFLTFTLPGVISYLASRSVPNLQIIKSLLKSESTPTYVLELVNDELRDLLSKVDTKNEDAKFLQGMVKHARIPVPLDQAGDTPRLLAMSIAAEHMEASSSKRTGHADNLTAAIQAHDPLTASIVIGQSLKPVQLRAIQRVVDKAIRQADSLGSDELRKQYIDNLADVTALIMVRSGLDVKTEDFISLPTDFKGRLYTWTYSCA